MNQHKQKGAVLIVAMILLFMLTLYGVTAMNTTVLQIKMATNTQNGAGLGRSFQDAESGLSDAAFSFRAALTAPITGTAATGADWDVVIWETNPVTDVYLASSVSDFTTTRQFLRHIDLDFPVDGTVACYDGCDVDLFGNVDVDGDPHDPPPNFNCSGGSCGASPTPGDSIPGVYQQDAGTVDQIGSVTVDGNPAIQTGGGNYTANDWNNLIAALIDHASERNGTGWGTRTDPIIHLIDQDGMTINASTDGAGILVITAPTVTINGDFHFEGLIVMANPVGVSMTLGGNAHICGAIVVSSPSSVIDVGGAGNPEIVYCPSALANVGGDDAVSRTAWFEDQGS